jgi:hypothetical protein
MPSFEEDFIEARAKGEPVKYKDWVLIRLDRIPVKKRFSGTLRVISTNSEWKQAVRLKVNGKLIINSQNGNNFITWADDIKDNALHFEGTSKDLELMVYNAWEQDASIEKPYTNAWQHGAAMIVEVDGNTRRYRCNDGHPDDNFDDIIFEVTINE